MIDETVQKPARGWALTAWLIFIIGANLWTIYRYYVIIEDFVSHQDPAFTGTMQWALPTLAVLAAVNIVAALLLWFWRKIGLYLFVVTSGVAFILNLLLSAPITSAFLGLLGLVVLWALLRPRWAQFR